MNLIIESKFAIETVSLNFLVSRRMKSPPVFSLGRAVSPSFSYSTKAITWITKVVLVVALFLFYTQEFYNVIDNCYNLVYYCY